MRNWAKCRKCGDVIESKYRHDFVMCGCGAIFVDGGNDYIRRGGYPDDFINICETCDGLGEVVIPQEGIRRLTTCGECGGTGEVD